MSTSGAVRIAVDAMGGDFAPEETVKGAISAAAQGGVQILLAGDPEAIQTELARNQAGNLPIVPVPSQGVIEEGEPPIQALRQKPRASVVVAAGLVKEGKADALVSMGSTGATMAASAFALGLMDGIERPALGGPIIGLAPNTVILDVGSNLDCRPSQLLRFGALGAAFARTYLGTANPRVALLSVGAEEGKGNRQVKEAFEVFQASGLNFVGNVEGNDLAAGRADVVVCDGFVGNVVMKLAEGLGEALAGHLKTRLAELLPSEETEKVGQEVFDLLNRAERAGGGPLFGVKGIAVVGHGRAQASAVARAIQTARHAIEVNLLQSMEEELTRLSEQDGQ